MHAEVVAELAWALSQAGHSTLRFDYRGVGASQGQSPRLAGEPRALRFDELAGEAADLLAAAEQLIATSGGPVCAVGYSFGAAVALACAADPRIDRLVLIAPPTRW